MVTNGHSSKWRLRWQPLLMTCGVLGLVLLTGVWGMLRDVTRSSDAILQAELAKFESHAERTVSRIEAEIRKSQDLRSFVTNNSPWFHDLWTLTVQRMPEVLYGAVLSDTNEVLDDSGRELPPQKADGQGYDWIPLPPRVTGTNFRGIGSDAVLLPACDRTGNRQVLDVSFPIQIDGKAVGYYRSGLDYTLLQSKIALARRSIMSGWALLLLILIGIVIGACVSLYRLGMHTEHLERQLGRAETRRIEELHRLIIGLAHEIRNPLNAIRLNLFAFKKVLHSVSITSSAGTEGMLEESVEEIERMDSLINQLLGFARVTGRASVSIDVQMLIESVLRFLGPSLEQSGVEAELKNQAAECFVKMDPQALRQILINLVRNACQAMERGGRLVIDLSKKGEALLIALHDSGPGIESTVMPKIFEPFFSTRDEGVGMGLAVVKGLVESAGGSIECKRSELLSGMEFRIALRLSEIENEGAHGQNS